MTESLARRTLLAAWLGSAAVVTVLRFLNTAEPGWDLGLQILAAQNLLTGKGLSIYAHQRPDLSEPATLVTLTHFPAGYSLFAAALLAVGAGVGTVVKVVGAAATMLGWWGWAKLAQAFFASGLLRGRPWRWAALAIAVVTPLRFTPAWAGTDIVLWAAGPWAVIWLVDAADEAEASGKWLDWRIGAVCGVCVLMRYAGLFLVVFAGAVMLWQSWMRIRVLARRWALFGLGLLPVVAVQLYVNHVVSNAPARPGGLGSGERGLGFLAQRVWDGVPLLGAANYSWAFWIPGQALAFLTGADGWLPWRGGIVLGILVLFAVAIRRFRIDVAKAAHDPRFVAVGFFPVVPAVLWGCMTLSTYDYLGDNRYYWPLVPLSMLGAYALAAIADTGPLSRCLWISGRLYLAGYLAIGLAGLALLFGSGERSSMQRTRLIGTDSFERWPSMALANESYPARVFTRELLQQQPDALLWTSKAYWFVTDPSVDRSRLLPLTCAFLAAPTLTGPAHIIILTFDDPGPTNAVWGWAPRVHKRLDCFERLPDLRLLQRFPEDGVKVLRSDVPAGVQVILKP